MARRVAINSYSNAGASADVINQPFDGAIVVAGFPADIVLRTLWVVEQGLTAAMGFVPFPQLSVDHREPHLATTTVVIAQQYRAPLNLRSDTVGLFLSYRLSLHAPGEHRLEFTAASPTHVRFDVRRG